jgi:tetratricopeptide (TPR) repeat protein
MQMQCLIYGPFKAAVERGPIATLRGCPFLIVIDGLDECENKEEVQELIESMLAFFEENPFIPLRVFITSRVEQHIQSHLDVPGVRLEDLVDHCSDDDIDTFLSALFEDARRRDRVIRAYVREHGEWPTSSDKRRLVEHIDGSFIFASAVYKFIMGSNDGGNQNQAATPMDRLPLALNMNPGLDGLYAQTLARSEHLPHFTAVISTIALLFAPLPTSGIAELLGINTYEVVNVLVNLQAIIQVPGTDDIPVTLCHTSLRDFLTTESRSGQFFAHPSHHVHLLLRCFECELVSRRKNAGSSIGGAELGPATVAYSRDYYEDHLDFSCRFSQPPDLDHAIQLRREALQLSPYTPDDPIVIYALARSLNQRHSLKNTLQDLEEAIALLREALDLTPSAHPTYGALLATIARAMGNQYWHLGNIADLDEAIALHRAALNLFPSHQIPGFLRGLAVAVLDRYRRIGIVADLVEAISLYRRADGSTSMYGFGNALVHHFRLTGSTTDLEECISLLRESIALRQLYDPGRPDLLEELGKALQERYRHIGNFADLEAAIVLFRETLETQPPPHCNRAFGLSILGNAVLDRHRRTKDTVDLEEACSLLREAVRLQPLHYPERSRSLNGLGNALLDQYRCTGSMADLEEAISCIRGALGLRPFPHPYRSSSLHGLGDVLMEYYQRSAAIADLEEAIASYRESISLYPTHRNEHPAVRASLSRSLQLLYEQTRTLSHLQEAITIREELLVYHYPEGHQDRVECLGDLATLLKMRFDVTGKEEDLVKDEATRLSRPMSPA